MSEQVKAARPGPHARSTTGVNESFCRLMPPYAAGTVKRLTQVPGSDKMGIKSLLSG